MGPFDHQNVDSQRKLHVIFWALILLGFIKERRTIPISGPFSIDFTRVTHCEDVGTGEINFDGKIRHAGKGEHYCNGNFTLKVPWDDKVQTKVECQQLKNGAYVPKFFTHTFKTCDEARNTGTRFLTDIFHHPQCPYPADEYYIKELPNNISFERVPHFIYGSYRMFVTWIKDEKIIGCTVLHAEAIPKNS